MKTMRVPRRRWRFLVISFTWVFVLAVTLVDGVLEEDRCEDRCAFQVCQTLLFTYNYYIFPLYKYIRILKIDYREKQF